MSDASRQAAPARGGRWNLWLGIGLLGFCLLCVTLWFPRDIGSVTHKTSPDVPCQVMPSFRCCWWA